MSNLNFASKYYQSDCFNAESPNTGGSVLSNSKIGGIAGVAQNMANVANSVSQLSTASNTTASTDDQLRNSWKQTQNASISTASSIVGLVLSALAFL